MAFTSKAISLFLLFNILLAMAGHALASRVGPTKQKEEDVKQPDFFIEPDGSVLIPGIGRILVPIPGHLKHHGGIYGSSPSIPNYGGGSSGYSSPVPSGGGSEGSGSGSHIPGGDDTLVPNPGYEVPTPSAP